MEWSPEQVQTVGGVFAALIATFGLIVGGVFKFVGQRTDPMLGQLLNRQMDSQDKRDKLLDELVKSVANDRQESHKEHQGIIDGIAKLKDDNKDAHELQNEAHDEQSKTLATISPALDTLTQQLEQTENKVKKNMEVQSVTNGQILEALLRIEKELKDIKTEFSGLGERIEKTEQDVSALKADIIKQTQETPTIDPAPANQPVLRPTANATIKPTATVKPAPGIMPIIAKKIEPKPQAEEKDESNV